MCWRRCILYRNEISDSDFVLECEGEAIPCHKIVLVSAAKGLLKPGFKECKEGRSSLQCSAEVGRNLVKFLYTDEMDQNVFDENIEDFMRLGDILIIERLKQRAEQKILELLDRTNMAAFFLAGAEFNAGDIRKTAKKLLQANLDWLHKQENYKEAFGEKKDLLIEVYSELGSDNDFVPIQIVRGMVSKQAFGNVKMKRRKMPK